MRTSHSKCKVVLFQEVLYPIYLVLILAMIKYLTSPSTEGVIPSFPTKPVSTEVRSGQLFVSPNTTAVGQLMDRVTAQLVSDSPVTYVLFGSVDKAVNRYRRDARNVLAGINFADGTLQNLTYTIRMNYTKIASTEMAAVYSWKGRDLSACLGN